MGSELDDLEKLYEVNIQVYSLAPTQSHSEDEDNEENTPEIAATLLRRSHRHYSSTLYLNLYENHFSYIKDLARYAWLLNGWNGWRTKTEYISDIS